MKTIDFLPEQYRQRALLRRARGWWGICAVIFGSVIGVSSACQYWVQRGLNQQLADMQPAVRLAHEQDVQFAAVRKEVNQKEESAELYVYLRHPWPRSQVIAALVQQVPEQVQLHRFHVRSEQVAPPAEAVAPRKRNAAKPEPDKKLPPRMRDLEHLRELQDKAQTLVDLHGTTTDDAQLHLYVQTLAEHPLLVSAQVVSISSLETPGKVRQSQFVVRAQILPGYGQAGGPDVESPPEKPESAPVAMNAAQEARS